MSTTKIINILKNLIYDVLIIILIGAIVVGHINKKKPVSIFGYYFFTVLSGSMQNTLYVGDNIIVKKTDEYKVGDIITYKKDNTYVTHRVVKLDGDYVTTRGDANTVDDEPFNKKYVLGRFVYKSALLNFIIKNRLIIITIIISIIIASMVIKSRKKKVDEGA